jgi:predicted DNA repair protein MutK
MAASSLLALIDDIASILDDVSAMTKVAAKKTAGVLGDDLALNAEQVSGVNPDRELPVVWAVAKGSFINKAILVPAALAISALAPKLITPLLMIGGAFLCYEGVEKLLHAWLHSKEEEKQHHDELLAAVTDPAVNLVAHEKDKIKGAIRTDFILSAEIIVISLNAVASAAFGKQVAALVAISVLFTVGVYGLVAAIVKLDDAGLALQRQGGAFVSVGKLLLRAAPFLLKTLSVLGTAAMFLVGGGILTHGWHTLDEMIHHAAESVGGIGGIGFILQAITPMLLNAGVGILVGLIALALVSLAGRLFKKSDPQPA